ncbi:MULTISPECIES: TcpQ domain-containing protein [Marinobacter]|nr:MULTISPECIES: TcpQ domain-containing protein [Marinobacter]
MMALASEKDADKPAVEVVEGAFPGEFSSDALFEIAPMARTEEVITYKINKGEKLREAMTRWTTKAGYELVWQPAPEDGDIIFAADMAFTDTFADAADSFFEVVRAQTKFDGKLHSNKVLRVFVANAKR